MNTTTTTERMCHNCGFPQGHRFHDMAGLDALPNGCSYIHARPMTLWQGVLWPAMVEAAATAGVEPGQAYRALFNHVTGQYQAISDRIWG